MAQGVRAAVDHGPRACAGRGSEVQTVLKASMDVLEVVEPAVAGNVVAVQFAIDLRQITRRGRRPGKLRPRGAANNSKHRDQALDQRWESAPPRALCHP